MLSRESVEKLLSTQARAYALLIWIGDRATNDPSWLAPDVVASLAKPALAARCLELRRREIPAAMLPDGPLDSSFVAIFSSFFETSFRVQHLAFDDVLVDAKLKLGTADDASGPWGVDNSLALALKHLASSEGVFVSEEVSRRMTKRSHLRESSLIWAYVWELDRRARGKGKGPVVRKIWRSIPWETRKVLSVDSVWQAREQLLVAAREHTSTP